MIGMMVILAINIEVKVATTRGRYAGWRGTLVEVGTRDTLIEHIKQGGLTVSRGQYKS